VHCTWATVGFLFFKTKAELSAHFPDVLPTYLKSEYDPYAYISGNELDPIYHFAPELIEQIKNTKGQEIGTHTFSHFYTLERNTTAEQFKSDIKAAIDIANKNNIQISSIIFPRNQYSDTHIKICREAGIKVFRGNAESKAYSPVSRENENLLRRSIRLIDSYINITGHCQPVVF